MINLQNVSVPRVFINLIFKDIDKEKTLMDDLKAKLKERNEKKKMNEENNINKNEGIYKSNDLERIIKQHKNEQTKANIKKPDSNINTIFDSIENDYNLSEEENNNLKCDRNFSFGKKFSGTFGKEEKNENNIENNKQIILNDNKEIKEENNKEINDEKDKKSDRDIKLSFKINSELNESEFNDINYL